VYSNISSQLLNVNSLINERYASLDEALAFLKGELMNKAYSYQEGGVTKLATVQNVVFYRTSYASDTSDYINTLYFETSFNEPSADAYTLRYEWTNAPANVTLPTNSNTYQNYANRAQNFDTTFTKDYQVNYNSANYTFSGWTETISSATSDGVVITLAGEWAKVIDHEHNYTSAITTPPTCSATGVRTYTCSICSDSYTEVIQKDASKHAYGNLVPEVPATTTAEGVKEHKTCADCNKHFDRNGNELSSLVIEKLPASDTPSDTPSDNPSDTPSDKPSEDKGGCGTIVPPTIGGNGTNGSGLTALLLSSAFIALLAFTLRFGKKKKASKN
jgi:hypothetical protein